MRDDGIGIEPGLIEHVFDLFAQIDNVGAQGSGLGIGLNLAKRLIELHGGTIAATSAGKGHGTEFVVRLPVSEEEPDLVAERSLTQLRATVAQKPPLRVLVVDDNRDAADMLVYLLNLCEQNVRSANDGDTAARVAQEFRPHLVLLDIGMPNVDGREVARRLRADPVTKSAFLVAVTGFSPGDAALDMSPTGFDARITKPLENEALLALIARVQDLKSR